MWLWKDTYLLDIQARGDIHCIDMLILYSISDVDRMFDKSALFIFPVCLLAVAWNIPKFFELKTCYLPLNDSSLESGEFRGSYKNNDKVKNKSKALIVPEEMFQLLTCSVFRA